MRACSFFITKRLRRLQGHDDVFSPLFFLSPSPLPCRSLPIHRGRRPAPRALAKETLPLFRPFSFPPFFPLTVAENISVLMRLRKMTKARCRRISCFSFPFFSRPFSAASSSEWSGQVRFVPAVC